MKKNVVKLALVVAAVLLLAGCRTYEQRVAAYAEFLNLAAAKNSQDFVVELQTTGPGGSNTAPGNLMVLTDSRCKNDRNPHKGCLRFEQNESGQITFELNPHTTAKTCGSTSSPTANSVIVKIELSVTPDTTTGDPASKGLFNSPANLPEWAQKNAFPAVDLTSGVVYEAADLASGLTRVSITNVNNHHNPGPKFEDIRTVWYRVTVQSCSDPTKFWRVDPRDDNEGIPF